MLDEPASEHVAAQVQAGVVDPIELEPLFSLDSGIRVQQELVFADLFGENVLIGNLFDSCSLWPDIREDFGVGTATGMAQTDDGRWYSIEAPLAAALDITPDRGYPDDWALLASTYQLRGTIVWAMLRSAQNSQGVPVWGVNIEYTLAGHRLEWFFVLRRLEASHEQFEIAWDRADLLARALSSRVCLDLDGEPLLPDPQYDACTEAALEDYLTRMRNRTRGFTSRGVLGILVIGGGGIACVAFPPSCPITIPVALTAGLGILYDGVDLWADTMGYGDELDNAYDDCCRDLRLRQ